jgi:hypothetical protein
MCALCVGKVWIADNMSLRVVGRYYGTSLIVVHRLFAGLPITTTRPSPTTYHRTIVLLFPHPLSLSLSLSPRSAVCAR